MKTLIAAAGLLLAVVTPSAAQPVDVVGTWQLNVTTQQGPMPTSTMVLKKEADKIFGTISSEMGEIGVDVEIKDKAVAIYGTLQTGSGPLEFALIGTVDGNTMKGTVGYAGATQGEFAATRAAAQPSKPEEATPPPPATDKVDVTGTWNMEVTTEMGSGSNTMTFKQEGEKLSGQYSGQYGQFPLTGTVTGKDIRFSYTMTGESATITVTYVGAVDKDTMKGTITIGDMGSGTFVGKKAK